MNKYTIYLDFDGTVVEHDYPRIGRCNFGCIEIIHKLQQSDHEIILNTMRVEFKDGSLEDALMWFDKAFMLLKNKEKFEDFNLLPIKSTIKKLNPIWDWEYFKNNNEIYIDDIAFGIPIKKAVIIDGYIVDWDELDKQFEQNGLYRNQ